MNKLIIDDDNYITYDDNAFNSIVGNEAHKIFFNLSKIARCIIDVNNLKYTATLEHYTIVQLLKELNKINK